MRVIARLDVKNEHVIKGIHLEGLRKIGNPNHLAQLYYTQGVDEILFMDAVASLYDRNNILSVIESASRDVFVPITVGGGIRKIEDIECALKAGADKVAINTAAVRNIELITLAAKKYGSQCIVGSIEAKKNNSGSWEVYIQTGREPTGLDVIDWAKKLEEAGIGELLVTSVDMEGTRKGFDVNLVSQLHKAVLCPIIVSGGYGRSLHLTHLLEECCPSAVALSSVFHYHSQTVKEVKEYLKSQKIEIRL